MKLIKVKDISQKMSDPGGNTMELERLYLEIYELKGTVDSLSLLSDYDESFHNPIIEKVSAKIDDICALIQKDMLLGSSRTQLESNIKGVGG